MAKTLRKGTRVVPRELDSFPGAAGYTPYVVIRTHRDHTVDLAIDFDPFTAVATRVKPRKLRVIDED